MIAVVRRERQTASVQRFGHAESVEHAADAVDAEAPEGTFAVLLTN